MTTLIDTHRLITELQESGFTKKQAVGVTEAIKAQNLDHLATKADLITELRSLEIRILKWAVPMILGQTAVFAAVVSWLG